MKILCIYYIWLQLCISNQIFALLMCNVHAHKRTYDRTKELEGACIQVKTRATKAANVLCVPSFFFCFGFFYFIFDKRNGSQRIACLRDISCNKRHNYVNDTMQWRMFWMLKCSNESMRQQPKWMGKKEREKMFINFNACRRRIGCRRHICETAPNANTE